MIISQGKQRVLCPGFLWRMLNHFTFQMYPSGKLSHSGWPSQSAILQNIQMNVVGIKLANGGRSIQIGFR
jgi:hypothetical protein